MNCIINAQPSAMTRPAENASARGVESVISTELLLLNPQFFKYSVDENASLNCFSPSSINTTVDCFYKNLIFIVAR